MISERLEVNGREYVQAAVAAEYVGYSTHYVLQLARGKWVDASVIQEEYYIDLQSLTRFVALAEQDKYEKSVQRDRRLRAANILATSDKSDVTESWVMIAKSGVVTVCGLLVGMLVWTTVHEEVQLADIRAGAQASTGQLLDIIQVPTLHTSLQQWWCQWLQKKQCATAGNNIYIERTDITPLQTLFSDEVIEIARTYNTITVRPVLENGTLGLPVTVRWSQ